MIIAIDLGTSNTSVCLGQTQLYDEHGNYEIPSAVSCSKKTKECVLYGAISKQSSDPDLYHFMEFKRYISNPNSFVAAKTEDGGTYTISDIFHYFLTYIISLCSANPEGETVGVVVTVPSKWSAKDRERYVEYIGKSVGLDVLGIYEEPVAAVVSEYGLQELTRPIMVFDMGAGTTDVSLVYPDDRVVTRGNHHFGGTNITMALYQKVLDSSYDIRSWMENGEKNIKRKKLYLACEKAKIDCATGKTNCIYVSVAGSSWTMSSVLWDQFIRIQFYQKVIEHVVDICPLEETTDIIFVGGPCGSENIRNIVLSCRSSWGNILRGSPKHCVSSGAMTLYQDMKSNIDNIFDNENENEHENDDILMLQNTTKHDIGVKTKDGLFSVLIPAGSPYPSAGQATYTTYEDGIDEIEIEVYEGDHFLVEANTLLYKTSHSIPKRDKGLVRVILTLIAHSYDKELEIKIRVIGD